jgi:hypothetical protein
MQIMDINAYGQRKDIHDNSRFNYHARFETQEDTRALCSADVCLSDFFLSDWLKGQLQHRQLTDADQLFDAGNDIFTSLSIATIEDVFRNWIHPLEQMIEFNGDPAR